MDRLLSLRDVNKCVMRGDRELRVLVDVSLDVDRGEIVAVVGSRDCGKSTLLRVAAGLEAPDTGEVWFEGQKLIERTGDGRSRAIERVGVWLGLAKRTQLIGHEIAWTSNAGPGMGLKIRDYVGLSLTMGRRRGRSEVRALADEALERVGAAHCGAQRWEELENWERVLVALARGIVSRPRLLIIDDLLEGLAGRRMQEVGDLLHELVRELDCGVLMSAPDLDAGVVADCVWSFTREGLRLTSDQTHVGVAEVIDFPSVPAPRRGVGL